MSDFQQDGVLTTFHRLGVPDRPRLEQELVRLAQRRPLALVLPLWAGDMETPAFTRLVEELAAVPYLQEVVVSLGGGGRKERTRLHQLLQPLPQNVLVLHAESRPLKRLLAELKEAGLETGREGKGRAVWLAVGLVLARGRSRVIALHDCDIAGYDRLLLARLVWPVMNPSLGLRMAKGYYARIRHQMYGRLTRLMVFPLLAALEDMFGAAPFLRWLRAFRYPLAGEMALEAELAGAMYLPADWGLEVTALAEAWRLAGPRAVCQVEVAESYDHKHQELAPQDPTRGLHRMAIEVAAALVESLAAEGLALSAGVRDSLPAAYLRRARDMLEIYAAEAGLNGLAYDRRAEAQAVEVFARALVQALQHQDQEPLPRPRLAPWPQVWDALPEFPERLQEAAEAEAA
jgi:glucosyl-3-phosphoglycerate synthase